MFVLKRTDDPSFYSINPPMDNRVDHVWSKDINFAKVYLTRNPATRQMNEFNNNRRWSWYDMTGITMEVVEVKLVEVI